MYSLVSAPVLGFDLVRRPGGGETAMVIATALALGPHDLPALADVARPDVERLPAWARVAAATRTETNGRASIPERTSASDSALPGQPAPATVAGLRKLATTAIGTLDDLLRCVRHD